MSRRFGRGASEIKVYIGELGNSATEREIYDHCSRYGRVRNVWVARRPPGFAFVNFEDDRDAEDFVRDMDGRMMCGHRVRVEISHGKSRWPNGAPPTHLLRQPAPRWVPERGRGGRSRSRDRRRSRSRSRTRSRTRSRSRDRQSRKRSRRSRTKSRTRSRTRSRSRHRSSSARRSGSGERRRKTGGRDGADTENQGAENMGDLVVEDSADGGNTPDGAGSGAEENGLVNGK